MKQFDGFPVRMQFTPIPNVFLNTLLPQIDDIAELKTTLQIFEIIYPKRGYPRFVSYIELQANKSLMAGFQKETTNPEESLCKALDLAVQRGTILHLKLHGENSGEDIYFLNDDAGRQAVAKIESGELQIGRLKATEQPYARTEELPDIFRTYEENIGMITPLIADELREAEKLYPATWLSDAIKEAVTHNRRNWRYIARILENWSAQGKSDGTHQRDIKKEDPNKYVKGRYGHMVRR